VGQKKGRGQRKGLLELVKRGQKIAAGASEAMGRNYKRKNENIQENGPKGKIKSRRGPIRKTGVIAKGSGGTAK